MCNTNFDHLRGNEYSKPRKWIYDSHLHSRRLGRGATWEELKLGIKNSEEELLAFLDSQSDNNDWPNMRVEEWYQLVAEEKLADEETIRIENQNGAACIHGAFENNDVTILEDHHSSWHTFRNYYIQEKHFSEETMNTIERASFRTLKRLSSDTRDSGPIKGLIIGNVQSGKTANMAGLMAMAADWGWNMFIVLSGTIESLRLQTLSRLTEDLNQPDCLRTWRPLDFRPKPNLRQIQQRTSNMHWGQYNNDRYLTVCLKNSTRLRNLIGWLREDENAYANMKILVIDDEADQAGVNAATPDNERKIINSLIMSLVNGSEVPGNGDGREIRERKLNNIVAHCQAMNYIAYTATPYANLLNESDNYTLYPKDFISTLAVSKEYFGPQQLFGCEDSDYDGMDIIREISADAINEIKTIHGSPTIVGLPESFKDAICWFMCGVACMRAQGYSNPISMLVHTSSNTNHHTHIAAEIDTWIRNSQADTLIARCQEVWLRETSRFGKDQLFESYPDYVIPKDQINDYLPFESIEIQLRILLGGDNRISKIQVEDGNRLVYHDGIHLCIDNSRNNGIDDENQITRLIYPLRNEMPQPAPAFIVVGGATLSRGLTIEGLISTYFVRTVNLADALMQMGRWFGYRRGYELMPRIWLTEKSKDQFDFLSKMDDDLRKEIYMLDVNGISPSESGPRILSSPKRSFIQLCARNKSQSVIPADMNYTGAMLQTYLFDNNDVFLRSNLDRTKTFLESLGNPIEHRECNRNANNALVWKNVYFDNIRNYLTDYHFQSRLKVLNDLEPLFNWIQQMTNIGNLDNWSVILAGLDRSRQYEPDALWTFGDNLSIPKIQRAPLIQSDDNIINIKSLRNVTDILADIDLEDVTIEQRQEVLRANSTTAQGIRDKMGYNKIPELIIYIINKDSQARKANRRDLNSNTDIAGIFINIPGGRHDQGSSYVYRVTIKLDKNFQDGGDISDDEGDNNNQ